MVRPIAVRDALRRPVFEDAPSYGRLVLGLAPMMAVLFAALVAPGSTIVEAVLIQMLRSYGVALVILAFGAAGGPLWRWSGAACR